MLSVSGEHSSDLMLAVVPRLDPRLSALTRGEQTVGIDVSRARSVLNRPAHDLLWVFFEPSLCPRELLVAGENPHQFDRCWGISDKLPVLHRHPVALVRSQIERLGLLLEEPPCWCHAEPNLNE